MKIILLIAFLLFPSLASAQTLTCTAALAAKPQGPFPCSVTTAWVNNWVNDPSGSAATWINLERRLNAGPWIKMGGDLPPTTTSAIDGTLQQSATADNVYDYRVITGNSAGTTPGTSPIIASFTVPKTAAVVVPPKPATGITVTFKGATGELGVINKKDPTKTKVTKLSDDDGTFSITGDLTISDVK